MWFLLIVGGAVARLAGVAPPPVASIIGVVSLAVLVVG